MAALNVSGEGEARKKEEKEVLLLFDEQPIQIL